MRVISGDFKGHPLKSVPTQSTRPTTDKVKEALFQIIGPYFESGYCLDLFAGSGGLGIEALSRGIEKAVFVDKHPKAIQTIHTNLRQLGIEDRAEVYRTDAFRAIKAAGKRQLMFKLIFLDPPYTKISYEKLMDGIAANGLLSEQGIIVCEHEANEVLPAQYDQFVAIKQEIYGSTTAITLYKK